MFIILDAAAENIPIIKPLDMKINKNPLQRFCNGFKRNKPKLTAIHGIGGIEKNR